jgi:hypothetical protein
MNRLNKLLKFYNSGKFTQTYNIIKYYSSIEETDGTQG